MKWAKIIISSSFYISFKANPSLSKPIRLHLFQKTVSLLSPALNGLSVRLNTVAPVVQPSCCSCHKKKFRKPLEGFPERSRRFRRKIIHLTANTYVCIGTYILKRWHIHTEASAHTYWSVGTYMRECKPMLHEANFQLWVLSYEWWVLSVYFFLTSDG